MTLSSRGIQIPRAAPVLASVGALIALSGLTASAANAACS